MTSIEMYSGDLIDKQQQKQQTIMIDSFRWDENIVRKRRISWSVEIKKVRGNSESMYVWRLPLPRCRCDQEEEHNISFSAVFKFTFNPIQCGRLLLVHHITILLVELSHSNGFLHSFLCHEVQIENLCGSIHSFVCRMTGPHLAELKKAKQ